MVTPTRLCEVSVLGPERGGATRPNPSDIFFPIPTVPTVPTHPPSVPPVVDRQALAYLAQHDDRQCLLGREVGVLTRPRPLSQTFVSTGGVPSACLRTSESRCHAPAYTVAPHERRNHGYTVHSMSLVDHHIVAWRAEPVLEGPVVEDLGDWPLGISRLRQTRCRLITSCNRRHPWLAAFRSRWDSLA